MSTSSQFDLKQVLLDGEISNELTYERALIADRKLRMLCKENPRLEDIRLSLRRILERYEDEKWKPSSINTLQIQESDLAELIAEKERLFIKERKRIIKSKLKELGLNQQELGQLLGHPSKSYISELINGIYPFTLNDLVIINRLLQIKLENLIPTTLSVDQRKRIKDSLQALGNKKIRLSSADFDLVNN